MEEERGKGDFIGPKGRSLSKHRRERSGNHFREGGKCQAHHLILWHRGQGRISSFPGETIKSEAWQVPRRSGHGELLSEETV